MPATSLVWRGFALGAGVGTLGVGALAEELEAPMEGGDGEGERESKTPAGELDRVDTLVSAANALLTVFAKFSP